jgi:hypothetical protein
VNKLRLTVLLIGKKQKYKHRVLTEETLDDIGARFGHTPRKSLNGLAQECGVLKFSARRATSTEEERLYGWFQQDSVTAHTARIFMQASSDVFEDRIISSGIWTARSSDLNSCNFLVWGCLKDKL